MTTRGRQHTGQGRRVAAVTLASTLTVTLGLAVGSAVPAQAASAGWDPLRFSLPWLPAPSVDGEISVTQVDADGSGSLRTFTRAGAPAGPAQPITGKDHVWGPGGDAVAGHDGRSGWLLHDGGGDAVQGHRTGGPALWSPFGDSTTESYEVGTVRMPSARWSGDRARISGLIAPTAHDPGTPAVTPDGYGVVVSVPAAGGTGTRDLGLAAKDVLTEFPAFPRIANSGVQTPLPTPTPLGYGALDARHPEVSTDGTLAFVGTGPQGSTLYVDEGEGPVAVAPLGADCTGQRPAFAPSSTRLAVVVSSADCSQSTLSVVSRVAGSFAGAVPVPVVSAPAGTRFVTASWRARTPDELLERIAGGDRVATGVAVSEWGWAGSEEAVLTSSTSFADAVVGGPLAGTLGVPLLVTGPASLDARVLAELQRLMSGVPTGSRVVHLVGGTGAVSAGVESTLRAKGFTVRRHAGADRYATSVAVARVVDALWDGYPGHTSVLLADGRLFPDALSAGPAAVQMSAPVLLTRGTDVPASVRAHIAAEPDYATVYGVGGAAATAASRVYGSRAVQVAGRDRYVTNAEVVRVFFPGASVVGYASGDAFPDALTGGALMGAMGNPLVLTAGTRLSTSAREIGALHRASTEGSLLFGGTGALADAVEDDIRRYAGHQTALWGFTSPVVPNPDYERRAERSSGATTGPGVGRLATNGNALLRPRTHP